MKLYSRRHVAIIAVVVSMLALGAGILVTALVIVPRTVKGELASLPRQDASAFQPASAQVIPVQYTTSGGAD